MELEAYPEAVRAVLTKNWRGTAEARLYRGRPARVKLISGEEIVCGGVSDGEFAETVSRLMRYSLYAVEDELSRGFFTLCDGSRVGVCGEIISEAGSIRAMGEISSICVRFAREIIGCAEPLRECALGNGGLLIVSPPGMGKTTLLRDAARIASDGGSSVCVIDERGEIAAAARGTPALDVGARTDVFSYGNRRAALGMAVRAMSPQIIVTDEIGLDSDAEALLDAARCGVRVFATAHGDSLKLWDMRRSVRELTERGVFGTGALLGGKIGNIVEIREM